MIVWTKILDQVSKVQVKSITDPLFQYSAILFSLGAMTAIFQTDNWVIITLFILGGLLLIVGLIFYIYFSITNPDYLRSENFQIKKQTIQMLGDKDNTMNPNIKELKFIASPFSGQTADDSKNNFGE